MATPLTATKFRDAIKGAGVDVVEVGKWRTHNRGNRGTGWGPVHGVMIHHTVTKGTEHSVALCRDGYTSLPGPLCHGVIAKDGTVHLIGYGRANHAGSGDDDVLRAVIAEDDLPADNEANTDGNARFYGFEAINLGDNKDPWPPEQVEAIARAAAGICRAHGWGAESVIGHSEWQPGKVDPRGPIGTKDGPALTMDRIRARVAELLDNDTPPPAAPAKPKPRHQPFPGADWFHDHPRSEIVTAMGERLVAVGCSRYAEGPGPKWTDADRRSYAAWQRKCGYSGAAADGWPGRTSWDRLAVPYQGAA